MIISHGYSWSDIQRAAKTAVRVDRSDVLNASDAYDIALSAIGEYLLNVAGCPGYSEIVKAGWQAIYREVRTTYRSRGYRDGDYGTAGQPSMPRFVQYWGDSVKLSHEDDIVESLAVKQVMGRLPKTSQDAICALATHEDYLAAANSLGLRYSTLTVRLSVARRLAREIWFDTETAHLVRQTDRRIGTRSVPRGVTG